MICLDILRTLAREPLAGEVLAAELEAARGLNPGYDAALEAHRARWPALPCEGEARWFAESLGGLLTASVLLRLRPGAVGDGYVRARLSGGRGQVAGALGGLDEAGILDALGGGA